MHEEKYAVFVCIKGPLVAEPILHSSVEIEIVTPKKHAKKESRLSTLSSTSLFCLVCKLEKQFVFF
jgi:hypothetical protein